MKSSDLPHMKFVTIPAGTFTMGESWEVCGSYDETPHQVTITKPFELMTTPVTQALWAEVMGMNPYSHFKGRDLPVDSVSWEDTQLFIQRLNELFGTTAYRLPTEAEWEYACRASNLDPNVLMPIRFGSGAIAPSEPRHLKEYAWYNTNSGGFTHPVGQKQPNAWGLYDMLGNVWEWCQDWYTEDIKHQSIDPVSPSEGNSRVVRGGAWDCDWRNITASCRGGRHPNLGFSENGFRLAREPVRDPISDPRPGDIWVNKDYQEIILSHDMANPNTIQRLVQSGFLVGYVKPDA